MENFKQAFYEEATELLEQLEGRLLDLEQNPTDTDTIGAVFRIMHTIKGAAAMFGFTNISKFTHEIENVMESVRDGKVLVDNELITLTLKARDNINILLDNEEITPEMEATGNNILDLFRDYVKRFTVGGESSISETPSVGEVVVADEDVMLSSEDGDISDTDDFNSKMVVKFEASNEIFLNGTNPVLLIEEVCDMGDNSVDLDISKLPSLDDYQIELCYLSWTIQLLTNKTSKDVKEVFIFLDETSKIEISEQKLSNEISATEVSSSPVVASASVENNSPSTSQAVVEQKKQDTAPKEEAKAPISSAKPKDLSSQTIRVASDKLDKLFDLVGELVTFNARLSQTSVELNNTNLITLAEQSDRLISEIRSISMSMRMLPIGSTFSKFQRLVRDLSGQLGKSIEIETEGADTELDKTVIDRLSDPLVHMIRNSVDHGIEMPDVREASGKSRTGIVKLSAEHKGSFVNITISDDGAGLNKGRILKKAVDNGILKEEQIPHMPDSEIFDLIFAPGFSTAAAVTDVSGRGVGMDVVRKEISALGGSVIIKSEEGKGSQFILKLPLTLAIIEGLLTKVGNNFYILPLVSVEECSMFTLSDVEEENNTSFLNWRDTIVPFVNLKDYFYGVNENTSNEQIVIVRDGDKHMGFVVDKVVGNMQTVIKPLGKLFRNVEMISGATIMGDGTMALILDLHKLAENISKNDKLR